jgi:hypothetical protein
MPLQYKFGFLYLYCTYRNLKWTIKLYLSNF